MPKRLAILTAAALFAARSALAGGIAEPVMAPEVIAAETTSSASQQIIVPLMTVLLLGAALAGN